MSGYVTTVTAFVRTDAGTVQLEAGAHVPASVLDTEVPRLVAAGVITDAPVTDEQPAGDAPAPPPRGRRRGQSGTTGKA